ncbi:hypothetical protein RINTHH_16140 [Richelia intracellularis HH01]|jgi:hypothetical protein|uniref:Uncharacterized protein n=1 Tax=Richelia intracellularis HH01 TaxID=1165094 RepID=M1WT36_9NOST|nr:hypothetical protein [Richelia intracellularis]CCH67769.1 hypothetical protein RINTHH_16140 [Richelia intracellularis HH01]
MTLYLTPAKYAYFAGVKYSDVISGLLCYNSKSLRHKNALANIDFIKQNIGGGIAINHVYWYLCNQ